MDSAKFMFQSNETIALFLPIIKIGNKLEQPKMIYELFMAYL